MAGIPPLAGFFGKYYLLLHAQAQGLTVLVITGLATSVISTYYYLRLIKIFWFDDADEESTTLVICELTKAQALRLKVSELFLWSFPLFAGILTP
jgi:NADH:ubiquinone oxidoreductase subunit 2 (subunit N)